MSVINTTDDTFDADVMGADKPVIVDFWAEWCSPCKNLAPHLDSVAEEMADQLTVVKLNVDENPMTPSKFGVQGLPTLMLFVDGKVVALRRGEVSKRRIVEWFEESIKD